MDKFEKHIREKFQEREISPSSKAWGKIAEAMGEEKRPQNRTRLFWSVGVAASLLLVITLSLNYWNTTDQQPQENKVVEASVEDEIKQEEETGPVVITDQKEERTTISPKEDTGLAFEKDQSVVNPDSQFPKVIENPSDIGDNEREMQSPLTSEIAVVESGITTKIEDKLNEVLATVTALENNKIEVTDAEIDSLLMAAQQELLLDKVIQKNGKVDAMALLNEVEEELDQSFRDQLFDTLKEGFFKLRTAVADRNN